MNKILNFHIYAILIW